MTPEEIAEQLRLTDECIKILRINGFRMPSHVTLFEFDHITIYWESHSINNYSYSAVLCVYPDGDCLLDFFYDGDKYDFYFTIDEVA